MGTRRRFEALAAELASRIEHVTGKFFVEYTLSASPMLDWQKQMTFSTVDLSRELLMFGANVWPINVKDDDIAPLNSMPVPRTARSSMSVTARAAVVALSVLGSAATAVPLAASSSEPISAHNQPDRLSPE